MADENEDQWLYGDSVDGKDGFQENSDSQPHDNDSAYNNQDDSYQQNDDTREEMDNEPPRMQESMQDGDDQAPEENFERSNERQPDQDENSLTNDTKENGTNDGQNQDDGDGASDSESDDDVHVVIGDIKSTPAQYSSLNIKRGGLLTSSSGPQEKLKPQQPGKFSIDEFETIGVINGIPAHEYNLDQLEDKPWRQPGADITDYFNYGFNEETWRAYCERQKRMRSESGVGLILNAGTGGPGNVPGNPGSRVPQVTITNYNSKYSGIVGPKRAGPPPGRKMAGTIDVIGSTGLASRRNLDKSPPKENVIQVMTADRREYSRKPPSGGFPDMSVPPPAPAIPPSFDMPPPGYQEPVVPYFMPEPDPYYHSYEPTQDRQWGNDPTWQPTNVNIPLTGDDVKESGPKSIPTMIPPSIPPMTSRDGRERDRDRDRDRGRDRDREYEEVMMREREREREPRDRDRDREKESRREEREMESAVREEERDRDRSRSQYRHKESRHRHRSRSRSRRHKSRSRSPSRRKKKSRRSERERSKEESE